MKNVLEGEVLLSFSLGLAVRTFWSDLEKFPKSASGKILDGSGQHFGLGTFLESTMGPKKHTFAMKSFCEGEIGESMLPKRILWSLGPIWAGYLVPKPL